MRFHLTGTGPPFRVRAREPESGHEAAFDIRTGGTVPERVVEARENPGTTRTGG
ncbi:hypothetical protein [Nocardiopsis alba]|uniref:hypothetical protein n=1 Tax=Nocardiopsis alba TaxID=53437 RepID=UPI0035E04CDC